MSLPLFFTNKYIRSKKDSRFLSVISIITILGIAIGVTVVIISLTVLDGYQQVVSEKIIGFGSHIKIISFGNRNLPAPAETILKLNTKFSDNIKNIEPFATKLAIIKSKRLTEGVTLTGITESNKDLQKFIIAGKSDLSKTNDIQKIILGKSIAEKLFIKIGDIVTIFCLRNDLAPSINNPPSIEQFSVAGIFESGMNEYDDQNAFINLEIAQNLFGMGQSISGYNVKVKNISSVNLSANQIQDYLGYPYFVRTIFQIHQNIFTWLDLQKKPIPIVLGLIIFVAVFNIVGTLLMVVLERTKAIGIFRSLGANRKLIMKTFLYHSTFISIAGIIIGVILSLMLSYLQLKFDIISIPGKIYFVSKVPMSIELKNYIFVSAATFIISFTASLLPAWIASKIKPITAIRFD
jgi:lipoprotein-releasing system permease protein